MPLASRAHSGRTRDGVQCSPQHGLRVWGLILVVLLASLTQTGVPLALHGADGSGPGSQQAASDIIYICTGTGIQPVRLSSIMDGQKGVFTTLASDGDDTQPAASHAFCEHCAFCHALPVIVTGMVWSHPVGEIRFVVFPVGNETHEVMAVHGFDARGPPVLPA